MNASDFEPVPATEDRSPDAEDRIREFLARHGGGAGPLAETRAPGAISGRWEIGAADGYILRCDWSRMGSRQEMAFAEIAPGSRAGAAGSGAGEIA